MSKILATRLKKVIGKLIGEEQNAFIQGRYIMDGVLVADETIGYLRKSKEKSVVSSSILKKRTTSWTGVFSWTR